MKQVVLKYVKKNGLAYVLSAKMLYRLVNCKWSGSGNYDVPTLPRKLEAVHRKTTRRSNRRPSV